MKFIGLNIDIIFWEDHFVDSFYDWTIPTRLSTQMVFQWDMYYRFLAYDIFGSPL